MKPNCFHCKKDSLSLIQGYKTAVLYFCEGCKKTLAIPYASPSSLIYKPELSNIHPDAKIGEDCKLHSHLWIGADVVIGDNCKIEAFAFIPDGVTLEDNVFLGPRVTFTNDKYPPSGKWAKTLVKRCAYIGAGAIILPGLIIGENAKIGAGSVVTKDVPDEETWIGNPAKVLTKP